MGCYNTVSNKPFNIVFMIVTHPAMALLMYGYGEMGLKVVGSFSLSLKIDA